MKREKIKIKSHQFLNHNVIKIVAEKPEDYSYEPGQATDVAIEKDGWRDEKRPFTFTSLPSEDHLEFNIKIYPAHDGVTEQLSKLSAGDFLTVGEVYGTIQYKGKGIFIAGGAGITPFIAILKSLEKQDNLNGNSLIFANKTEKDIFLKEQFQKLLGQNYLNILSEEKKENYAHGRIDREFLRKMVTDFSNYFYVCGPPEMSEDVIDHLLELGAHKERIVAEDFDG